MDGRQAPLEKYFLPIDTTREHGRIALMRLQDYLQATGQSQRAFARRSGMLVQTVCQILHKDRASLESAMTIHMATGGLVSLADLCQGRDGRKHRAKGILVGQRRARGSARSDDRAAKAERRSHSKDRRSGGNPGTRRG